MVQRHAKQDEQIHQMIGSMGSRGAKAFWQTFQVSSLHWDAEVLVLSDTTWQLTRETLKVF